MNRAVSFSRLCFVHFLVSTLLDVTLLLCVRRWLLRRLAACDCECKRISLLPSVAINLVVSGYVGFEMTSLSSVGAPKPPPDVLDHFWSLFALVLPYTTLVVCVADIRVFTYYNGACAAPVLSMAVLRAVIVNVANSACAILLSADEPIIPPPATGGSANAGP